MREDPLAAIVANLFDQLLNWDVNGHGERRDRT